MKPLSVQRENTIYQIVNITTEEDASTMKASNLHYPKENKILGKYKAANFLDVLAYCAKTTTTAIANFSAALLANLHINRSV